jgi:hypothetical protein
MSTKRYHNGEPVIKDQIFDEPWYPHYQALREIAVRTGHTEVEDLMQAFHKDWKCQWSDSLTIQMVPRWAVLHVCLNQCLEQDQTRSQNEA